MHRHQCGCPALDARRRLVGRRRSRRQHTRRSVAGARRHGSPAGASACRCLTCIDSPLHQAEQGALGIRSSGAGVARGVTARRHSAFTCRRAGRTKPRSPMARALIRQWEAQVVQSLVPFSGQPESCRAPVTRTTLPSKENSLRENCSGAMRSPVVDRSASFERVHTGPESRGEQDYIG